MSLESTRVRAVCFDVDGTLRDTDDQYVERLASYLRIVRFLLPRKEPQVLARRLVMAIEDPGNFVFNLVDVMGIDNLISRSLHAMEKDHTRKITHPLVIPGVSEMLGVLGQRYPMAIVSTRSQSTTLAFLESSHLKHFFPVIVTGQTCARTKPHPMPVLWAAAHMGIPPEACLMVGDTKVDIRAGRAAGAQTAGVLCGFGMQAELLRAGADVILKSTSELTNYLL
jgi:phosphoglycolate phosphatase-like HAD superfamily hydrolase